MQNDLIEARLRRDAALSGFLLTAQARYADIEDDVAPLRAALAANLARATQLAQQVLGADQDQNPQRKQGTRNQLTRLLLRLARALRAHAKSTRNTDLAMSVPTRLSDLSTAGETDFAERARRLLDLGQPHAAALVKRRYAPEHHTQAEQLLTQFQAQRVDGRLADTSGSAGRGALERLVKENNRLKVDLEDYFITYAEDEPDLWKEFQAAAKVVRRGGGDGGAQDEPRA